MMIASKLPKSMSNCVSQPGKLPPIVGCVFLLNFDMRLIMLNSSVIVNFYILPENFLEVDNSELMAPYLKLLFIYCIQAFQPFEPKHLLCAWSNFLAR